MKINEQKLRTGILVFFGLLMIVGAILLARYIVNSKKGPSQFAQSIVKTAFVDTVSNGEVPIVIDANGSLEAKRRIELYSEVQGIFQEGAKPFKEGNTFSSGQTLISMDGSEYYSSIVSQRTLLNSQITSALVDLKLDYPAFYAKWQNYLNSISLTSTTPTLPNFETEQESYFINSRSIPATYHTIKNMEARYAKYTIRAPFTGVLTEALVTPGTLIRAGQKLGTFIAPNNYELSVAVNESYKSFLSVGKKVVLTNIEGNEKYEGKVVRVNSAVDPLTQTVGVFIEVSNQSLSEGMYLKVELEAKSIENAFEIERKMLVDNKQIFVVENDSILEYKDVDVLYLGENTAVVRNLKNGDLVLKKSIPGAYPGMIVKIEE